MKKLFFGLLFVFIHLVSCTPKDTLDPIVSHRDTTIVAGDDFFSYANGGWIKSNPIPASEKSNGIFQIIQDTINNQIKSICEKAADEEHKVGSNKQKIGDFYRSGMDSVAIDQVGIKALQHELNTIDAIQDTQAVYENMARLHTLGAAPGFAFYVGQDDKISSKNALFLQQGGLGLRQQEYYLNSDPASMKIRSAYVAHLSKILQLSSISGSASALMKLESALAKHSRKLEALRDPQKNYNKMSISQLNTLTPHINWNLVFPKLKIQKVDSVIVGQPEFFRGLDQTLTTFSVADWKLYLKWSLVNTYAEFLGSSIEKQNFSFYGTVMNGVKVQKPRWKRVVQQTDESLGELIGQVYVAEYLPKGTKEKLLEIGNSIRDVYAERIKKLDWMSTETKVKALRKLQKIVMKVGYPDQWKDLSSITIVSNAYCQNTMAIKVWEYDYMVKKYGKPVDRKEWGMYPQTYNAYYNPSNNEICVPACNIIVPGFEGRMPDDAVLYGIIGGSTFGHEITHGFDDQGSQYDENGNLNNWWTPSDYEKFTQKTKAIVALFNRFEVVNGKHVNGEATQGENIADLGGVVMGLEAFKKTKQYQNNEKISGLSPIKRYFLSYAYAWMVNARKEYLMQQVMQDVHSPAKFRINGPLMNCTEFYKAFNVQPGQKMYLPESERITIW
jgi:putative endopeptidase